MIQELARVYVNYVEPSLKAFVMFLIVLAVLAFWQKIKTHDILEIADETFRSTLGIMHKLILWTCQVLWTVCMFMGRVLQWSFVAIRDFFLSKM